MSILANLVMYMALPFIIGFIVSRGILKYCEIRDNKKFITELWNTIKFLSTIAPYNNSVLENTIHIDKYITQGTAALENIINDLEKENVFSVPEYELKNMRKSLQYINEQQAKKLILPHLDNHPTRH